MSAWVASVLIHTVLDCALHLLRGRSKGIAENSDARGESNMRRIWIWSFLCVGLLSANSAFAQHERIVACRISAWLNGEVIPIYGIPPTATGQWRDTLMMPLGNSASDCPNGANCVGGLTLVNGEVPMPFPASLKAGYKEPLFPVTPFKFQYGIRTTEMHDWVVSFQDAGGTTHYARVVQAQFPNQVVKVPKAAFGPNPPFPVGVENIVKMKAFTWKSAVECSNQGVPPKSIVAATTATKPDADWNVYQVTFPTQGDQSLTVDVLMHE